MDGSCHRSRSLWRLVRRVTCFRSSLWRKTREFSSTIPTNVWTWTTMATYCSSNAMVVTTKNGSQCWGMARSTSSHWVTPKSSSGWTQTRSINSATATSLLFWTQRRYTSGSCSIKIPLRSFLETLNAKGNSLPTKVKRQHWRNQTKNYSKKVRKSRR